jgi:hypothetical protein
MNRPTLALILSLAATALVVGLAALLAFSLN